MLVAVPISHSSAHPRLGSNLSYGKETASFEGCRLLLILHFMQKDSQLQSSSQTVVVKSITHNNAYLKRDYIRTTTSL